MYFFLDPLTASSDYLTYGREILDAYNGGQVVGIATVVLSRQSQNMGSRLLLRHNGETNGTLGSTDLDRLAVESIQEVSDTGDNKHILTADGTEIFVEGFTTPATLVIMGGGHVGKATSVVAKSLGFRIYIVDDRPEFSNKDRFPESKDTVVDEFSSGLDRVPINVNTYIVVATRGHKQDDMALEAAIRTPARYIGLMGSRRKTLLIYKNLLKKGYSPEELRKVNAPIGLDIGALTPEEIAVSIMSEIVMVRRGGSGGSMQMDEKFFNRAIQQAEVKEWTA